MLTIHILVLPLHRKRPAIPHGIKPPDHFFKIHRTAAQGTEFPISIRMAKRQMAAENAGEPRRGTEPGILHMGVIDPRPKFPDELHIVHSLIDKMRGVVIESQGLSPPYRIKGLARGNNIKGDFRRMHFQGKHDIMLIKNIKNRIPTPAKIFKTFFQLAWEHRGKE